MISYGPLWETLKKQNISTYKLEHSYKSLINNLRHDKSVTMNTIDRMCKLFNCEVSDVVKCIRKDNE